MGATMCVMALCHRNTVTPDLDAALRSIENLTTMDVAEYDFQTHWGFGEIETDGRSESEILVDVQDTLRSAIVEMFDSLDWRDVTMLIVAGWTIYITGGMDGNTDSFEVWSRLIEHFGPLGERVLYAAGFEFPPAEHEPFKIEEEASIHD